MHNQFSTQGQILRSSRILENYKNNRTTLVIKINFGDPRVVELAGFMGFEAVWFCNEHVPTDWILLENMIRAARLHNMDSLVRVDRGSYSDYIRPLEAGATGIIVPHVANAKEAETIISQTRFSPIGKRAIDPGSVGGAFCGMSTESYIKYCNQEQLVILQIESEEGLQNLDSIASQSGYNGLLFGLNDYSHQIGQAECFPVNEGREIRKEIARVAHESGKISMSTLGGDRMDIVKNEGHDVVVIAADVMLLRESLEAKRKEWIRHKVLQESR